MRGMARRHLKSASGRRGPFRPVRSGSVTTRALVLAAVLGGSGCTPTIAPPPACPEPEPEPGLLREGPVPPLLKGHFEVETIQPKGHPAQPPETYLLAPEERAKCAYVRIVLSFDADMLRMRYDALCVEPEDRAKNPVPLKWCSTEATTHVIWDIQAFELPVPSGSQSNVQQIASFAPGSGPSDAAQHERTVWGCKFNLDAQRFEILERGDGRLRLRAPKYEAEWVLRSTTVPNVDPDEVVSALRGVIHSAGAQPPPAPLPPPPPPAPPGRRPSGDDKL